MKTSSKSTRKVKFQVKATPGSKVYVAGSFNNWDTTQYPLKDNPDEGLYRATLPLPAGRHEYKFLVNGNWLPDPNCTEAVLNPHGTHNSVVTV